MRKLLLTAFTAIIACTAQAQIIADTAKFESLPLSGPDTFYVNYTNPGSDVGFLDAHVWFPSVYDTGWGMQFWASGFAYSNLTDTVTSGIVNQYAAKAGSGQQSDQYAVAYGSTNYTKIGLTARNFIGLFITNSTYAYNSMRDGDAFSKKFGGTTGDDPDWFKLTIRPFFSGAPAANPVEVYLADFRDSNNANDFILKDWKWVELPYNLTDSIVFELSSSDTGQFGMNTPAYFCLDNFVTAITTNVNETSGSFDMKMYPNPASSELYLNFRSAHQRNFRIVSLSGQLVGTHTSSDANVQIPVQHLPTGDYIITVTDQQRKASVRFQKL